MFAAVNVPWTLNQGWKKDDEYSVNPAAINIKFVEVVSRGLVHISVLPVRVAMYQINDHN